MSCGVGGRHGSDMALLRLWGRPAAVAPIGPLAWELPNATGAALKRKKKSLQVGAWVQRSSGGSDAENREVHESLGIWERCGQRGANWVAGNRKEPKVGGFVLPQEAHCRGSSLGAKAQAPPLTALIWSLAPAEPPTPFSSSSSSSSSLPKALTSGLNEKVPIQSSL